MKGCWLGLAALCLLAPDSGWAQSDSASQEATTPSPSEGPPPDDGPAPPPDDDPTPPPDDDPTPPMEGINRETGEERKSRIRPLDLVLQLPEAFVEVAFTPLLVTVWAIETYDLADRLLDLVSNPERTAAFLPIIQPFGDSGLGFGGLLAWNAPLGGPDRLVLTAVAFLNEDWNVSVDIGRRLPFVRGRELSIGTGASVTQVTRFYGFGSESRPEDLRLVRRERIDLDVRLTLLSPAIPILEADAGLAFRRRELGPGQTDSAIAPPLDPSEGGDVPTGFNQSLDYPEASVRFGVDTRDSFGLTSRGIIWNLDAAITHDVNGADLGAVRGTTDLAWFIPLAPRGRTLFLRLGAGTVFPFRGEDSVPYHMLNRLGGNSRLRGYPDDRFVDELAWWGTVEYRWFFYEWAGTGGGLVGTIFFDAGQVGSDLEDLFQGNVPWSTGFSIRVEQSLIMLGRLQFGFSPEGVQISFGIGDLL